jgi:lipopolysaccharide/colanic/teichoic acid biosynthesis glycosyltransferase
MQDFIFRIFDIVFSLLIIIILSPIIILFSLIIIYSNGFPIFFKHLRVGKNGKKFHIYKFRSMVKDAEEILHKNKELYKKYVRSGYKINANEDPRILPVGKFIRKTSIDEIPQFFNVLRGDMSIVGPRPVVESEMYDLYKENFQFYQSVKPGITGLWQVSGRSNLTGNSRAALDIEGIKKKSIVYDFYIILKTVKEVFKRTGAY